MRLKMKNLEASFEEIELTESDYVLNAGSAWVRVNDLVLFIVNHGDRMAVRVFEHGTAYDTPLDAIEIDCNSSYSQIPHDPGCPAVDGFGCYCDQTIKA
jgi:hypothetical protein